MTIDAATLTRATATLMAKRSDTAKKIEGLLAGQNVDLSTLALPQEEEPGEPPLERLRRFARFLAKAAERLKSGDAERCGICGGAISGPEIAETPWVDTCRACGAKGLAASPPGGPAH